jgi:surface protein
MNFSERVKSALFSSNKIICSTQDEVRKVVDKIVKSNDWDVEVVCNFDNAGYLFEKKNYTDLSKLKLNTSKVKDMEYMFGNCISLKSIPQLDTSKVSRMPFMFYSCDSLKSIPQLDTSRVSIMYNMFQGCDLLTTIPKLNIAHAVTDSMFYRCESLKKLGYPIYDDKKMKEIISTTGIDGKPYKG